MGYIVHHAIVVTFWDDKILRDTWREAKRIFSNTNCSVTNITTTAVNGYRSYMIAPDGSKYGWDDSVNGMKARTQFIEYLNNYEPYPPSWALIQYGDEYGHDYMVDSNHINANKYYAE